MKSIVYKIYESLLTPNNQYYSGGEWEEAEKKRGNTIFMFPCIQKNERVLPLAEFIQPLQANMDDLCIYLSAVLASIQSDCLKQHNLHRRQHQAPDVTYSSELKEKAQSLAEFMAESDTQLEFFQGSVDENLFHGVSSHLLTISDAIQHW